MSRARQAARFHAICAAQVDPHAAPPERALLAAVLGQAISDATWPTHRLNDGTSGCTAPTAAEQAEARRWLWASDHDTYGVLYACEHLDLVVSAVRARVADALADGVLLPTNHLLYGARATAAPERVIADRRRGATVRELAVRYGMSQATVLRLTQSQTGVVR